MELTKTDREVLAELQGQGWLPPRHISGPMGSAQQTALRHLLAAGLIERRPNPRRANRNVTYQYRAVELDANKG